MCGSAAAVERCCEAAGIEKDAVDAALMPGARARVRGACVALVLASRGLDDDGREGGAMILRSVCAPFFFQPPRRRRLLK